MRINIAIIEDEKMYSNQLSEYLMTWAKSCNCEIIIRSYLSYMDYIQNRDGNYDVFFLDIQLKDGNGLDIAKQLRKERFDGDIIFLTSFQEYVFDGYDVNALYYLLKPTNYDSIVSCMDVVSKHLVHDYFIYRGATEYLKIPYSDIIYFNSSNHQTEIVTRNNIHKQYISFKSLFPQLPVQFYRSHRTAIINIDHLQKIMGKTAYLSNNYCVPISNTHLDGLRNAFIMQMQK